MEVFSFKLSKVERFRLGVMVDAFSGGAYSPDYVSVSEDASRKAVYNTTPLTRDGLPDLVLFDIEGIIFLGSNIMDKNLKAVEWSRKWIARVGVESSCSFSHVGAKMIGSQHRAVYIL